MKPTTYVGMDVHKQSIVIAMLKPDGTKPVETQVPNDTTGIRRLIQAFRRESELLCCYEDLVGSWLVRPIGLEPITFGSGARKTGNALEAPETR